MIYWVLFAIFSLLFVYLGSRGKKPLSSEEYFYSGYKLKAKELFFTFSASWIGGATLILLSEKASKIGILSLFIIPIPTIITLLLLFLLKEKIKGKNFFSIEGLISKNYGRFFGTFSSFVFLWYLVLLGASQLVALGKVGESFLKTDYSIFVLISASFIIFYSSLRGFGAIVRTDKIQLYIIFFGILALLFFIIFKENSAPQPKISESGKFIFELILVTLSFSLAWTVSPVSIQRIKATLNEKEIGKGLFFTAIFLSIFFLTIVYFGIKTGKGIVDFDYPHFLKVLIFLMLLSALFSTYDTVLNSAAISFNYLTGVKGFYSTVFIGFFSIIVALKIPSILRTLGLSSEIITESLFIPIIYLFVKRENQPAVKIGGWIVMIFGAFFSVFSFSSEIFNLKVGFKWPSSLVYSLPLLFLIFVLSFFAGRKKNE